MARVRRHEIASNVNRGPGGIDFVLIASLIGDVNFEYLCDILNGCVLRHHFIPKVGVVYLSSPHTSLKPMGVSVCREWLCGWCP